MDSAIREAEYLSISTQMVESCTSFPCISVPPYFSPQFPCFWWQESLPALLLHHSVSHFPYLKLFWRPSALRLLSEMLWLWPLVALLGNQSRVESRVGKRDWFTQLCRLSRRYWVGNSSLKSFSENHHRVSKCKLLPSTKEIYWPKQHTQAFLCLNSDASEGLNKCSSIITVHACVDGKEDITEFKTNQQNNKTNKTLSSASLPCNIKIKRGCKGRQLWETLHWCFLSLKRL